jgi:hypothetical protein
MKDSTLAELGRRYVDLNKEISELTGDKEIIKDKILAEMERRNTKAIETGGVRVTYAQGHSTKYDVEGLRAALSKPQWMKISERVLDKAKLLAALQSGSVSSKVVEKNTVVTDNKPYPVVNIVS